MADISRIKIPNGTEYTLKDAQAREDIAELNGSLEDRKAYAENIIVSYEELSGEEESYSDIRTLLTGTTVSGKIWHSVNKSATTNSNGKYTKYQNIGQYSALYIDASGIGKHACAAYYDASDNLLKTEYSAGNDSAEIRVINMYSLVPSGASYVIVNGSTESGKTIEPKVYALNAGESGLGALKTVTGEVVEDKAYKIDGSEVSGVNYCYTKYMTKPDTDYIYVSGESWGANYPLITFVNATGTVISSYGVTGSTLYERVEVEIPQNTFYYIVNGRKKSEGVKIQYPKVEYHSSERIITRTQADVNKLIDKRYLFIGDSYGEGYSHDGNNSGWIAYLAEYLGLSSGEYVSTYRGGYSFSSGTFKTLMEAITDENITDIVVCGGYNDRNATTNDIISGITAFKNSANLKWSNVRVHVGFVAWNKAGNGDGAVNNWEQIHSNLLSVVLPAYQKCVAVGCQYLNNVEYWINDDGITPSDGYHPSAAGNQSIAFAIANALKTGSAPLPYNNDLRLT